MTRRHLLSLVSAVLMFLLVGSSTSLAQADENPLAPLDTSSPQATYLSFVEQVTLLEELLQAYERNRSEASQAAFTSALAETQSLFDLTDVSSANRGEVVATSFASLADILNRLPPVDVDAIPDAEAVAEASGGDETIVAEAAEAVVLGSSDIKGYTLPGTEITIALIEEGADEGEYLFSAETVSRLPGWRAEVDGLPVNEGVVVRDWVQEEADFTGHLMPRSLVDALPAAFDRDFLGSPLWKFVVDVVILALVGALTWSWRRFVASRGDEGTPGRYLLRMTTPLIALVLIVGARRFMNEQVNHSGDVATIVNLIVTFVIWASLAWAFWLLTKFVVEWIIATPRISDDSVDAHLLRLVGKIISVAGAFTLLWIGMTRLGVSTVGLGIGAGVAGLAVALAATGVLENLLGGITVYADKPFAVDDTITVDDDFGKVEEIGPRSTTIRRLDDTLVILPNADISRAKVTNFSQRRHILFAHTVGVRYETSVDQLRTIVEAIDSRFRDHPLVLDEATYPRVQVAGFGGSSIDIEVRARIDTQDFPTFIGVQEELLLLVYEIVETAGSGFAFPSSTTYLAQDTGLPAPQSGSALLLVPRPSGHDEEDRAPIPADDEPVGIDDD